jgi:hypothetical protein
MRKPEWPGIATAVGIALILALIIAGSQDGFRLKEWQPLMAAIIALAGGALAYRGAMAKVNLDRETTERERMSQKLSLFLRLRHAVYKLKVDTSHSEEIVRFWLSTAGEWVKWEPIIAVDNVEELDDAWTNLELLPVSAITHIPALRSTLQRMEFAEAEIAKDTEAPLGYAPPDLVRDYRRDCDRVIRAATGLVAELDDAIEKLTQFG